MEEKNINLMRTSLYRLLGKIYMLEVDEPTLKIFKEMKFPENIGTSLTDLSPAEMDLSEGYALLQKYFAQSSLSDDAIIEELAVDYAKTFLSAGDQSGQSAFPYESVYASKAGQFGGENQVLVEKDLASKGLKLKEDMFRVMEDHIGVELEYMAGLIDGSACADCELHSNEEDCPSSVQEQKEFLNDHLLNWINSFTADVSKYATTDFYKGWAKVTNGFLGLEKEYYGL